MPDVVLPGAPPAATIGNEDMPANVDLKIYQGDYKVWLFQIADSNNTPIDVSNLTPKAQFKLNYMDSNPITLNTTIESNQVKMELTSTQSNGLVSDSYIYDIQLTDSAGRVKTYVTGDVTVVPQVTT